MRRFVLEVRRCGRIDPCTSCRRRDIFGMTARGGPGILRPNPSVGAAVLYGIRLSYWPRTTSHSTGDLGTWYCQSFVMERACVAAESYSTAHMIAELLCSRRSWVFISQISQPSLLEVFIGMTSNLYAISTNWRHETWDLLLLRTCASQRSRCDRR